MMVRTLSTARGEGVGGCWPLCAMLTVLLAACGAGPLPTPVPLTTAPTTTPAPLPTATIQPTPLPATTAPPTPIPTPSAPPAPTLFPTSPGGVPCGQIEIRNRAVVDHTAALTAEDCFWQAYQRCIMGDQLDIVHTTTDALSYASLSYRLMDAGGRCTIEEHGSAVPVLRDPTTGVTRVGGARLGDMCMGMTRDPQGDLHLTGCGAGATRDLLPP